MAYHKSIDTLPIWNWNKIHETGNLYYLEKRDEYAEKTVFTKELSELWTELNQQYIDRFGLGRNYKHYLTYMHDIALRKWKVLMTGNQSDLTLINALQAQADALLNKMKGGDFDQSLVVVERHMSREIDPRTISVAKYYSYLRDINKRNGKV